jgi:hypothetical protein
MWLALAAITLAAAIGLTSSLWQFSSRELVGYRLGSGRPCKSKGSPHVDNETAQLGGPGARHPRRLADGGSGCQSVGSLNWLT